DLDRAGAPPSHRRRRAAGGAGDRPGESEAVGKGAVVYNGAVKAVGDRCYDFISDSSRGGLFALASCRGQVVVLYFFLRAISLSRACVQQARRFRDNYP